MQMRNTWRTWSAHCAANCLACEPRTHFLPLPTMPAVLLQVLPTLPPQLEYRFIGRALILRDIDAALILDYLPDAITAR